MRKITVQEILAFVGQCAFALILSGYSTAFLFGRVHLGDFQGVVATIFFILVFYICEVAIYRLFMHFFPLQEGEIARHSSQEFIYQVYILFYLIFFYPVIRSGALPIPLLRAFYLALGARLGANTYSGGIIHDPLFVSLGSNCIVGQSSMLIPHIIEGSRLAHYAISIGDRVTIGAGAIILCDVKIADDAIVGVGAVVSKGSRIGIGETWAGIPARRIK